MNVLYEHFTDSESGKLLATDFLMTSVFPGKNGIHFRNNQHKMLFTYIKEQIFKPVPIKKRTMDGTTYIWSFFDEAGKQVYETLKSDPMCAQFVFLFRVENLAQMVKDGYVCEPKTKLDPEEFFYNKAGALPTRSKNDVAQDLADIFTLALGTISLSELVKMEPKVLKQTYNRAALRLHPDRNHDSGKAMSELNALWQEWSKL